MPKEYWMHQRRNLIFLTLLGLFTCDQVGETGTALSNGSAVSYWVGCKQLYIDLKTQAYRQIIRK
jgi:hypothetical protein